jgi:hypothetical protein
MKKLSSYTFSLLKFTVDALLIARDFINEFPKPFVSNQCILYHVSLVPEMIDHVVHEAIVILEASDFVSSLSSTGRHVK